ncbi:hypothetical protein [Thiomicrorhabdus indica]|uniref:hypothetical protein n=1 Tax=Thiomicrorhabdus indica TaxID=2267253 RepID=UPI002AA717FB|nr:hypothetical protein [Thiomicrorhabdus indica]
MTISPDLIPFTLIDAYSPRVAGCLMVGFNHVLMDDEEYVRENREKVALAMTYKSVLLREFIEYSDIPKYMIVKFLQEKSINDAFFNPVSTNQQKNDKNISELDPRERKSLYKLIRVMAKAGYGKDVDSRGFTQELVKDSQVAGYALSKDTIGKILKEIAEHT